MTGRPGGATRQPVRPPFSTTDVIDEALSDLQAHKDEWVGLPIQERIDLVKAVRRDFRGVQQRFADYSVAAKGTSDRVRGNDREWIEIATVNRIHTGVLKALTGIRDHGRPTVPGGYNVNPDGQVMARVFPDTKAHGTLFHGITMDVWLDPGVTLEEARAQQAAPYREANREGKVALVLGAGNASPLPPSDVFHKLFHDLRVVLLKMNPVNSYLGPLMEEAYRSLIERGFLRIVYGAADEGKYLVHHDLVDEVHMTGSDRTFEAIVFGPGEEGAKRKAAGDPIVKKPTTGELGCITPWIIVPGDWDQADVEEQAAKMAFWMMRHEGYICFAPRVLVLHKEWPQRNAFVRALIEALRQVKPIRAYYPGSADTQRAFVTAHPEAVQVGGDDEDRVPWTVIPDLDPEAAGDICFRRESFSGLCAETALEAESVPEYLDKAVNFCNNTIWGTLSANLVVSEESLADPDVSAAVERAAKGLRYGSIGINSPAVWSFYVMIATWGAFPGSDLKDIQSGIGKVSNFLMLPRPEKAVLRGPFRMRPYPFLGTAKGLDVFGKKLARFEEDPSWMKLPGLWWSAKRA